MKLSRFCLPAAGLVAVLAPTRASAMWIDGEGHYALLGETETEPAFQRDRGTYQAIQESFRLMGEARLNDQSSAYFEFRLFNQRGSYLGDVAEPQDCRASLTGHPGGPDPCAGQHQNTGEPGYKPYTPVVTQAYVRYAFDYCILEAGRRARDWGLGMFLNKGDQPFDTEASIFDGVDCSVNIQKSQTLGFRIGYDKLDETGAPVDPNWQTNEAGTASRQFGPNDPNDDLDQYWASFEFDDRKANAGATFTKQIGVYFAQITGKPVNSVTYEAPNNTTALTKETGGDGTDMKYVDLYTGFYIGDLAFKNEFLFRMGKSADPNWELLGGERYSNGALAVNKLDSIAFAGTFEWTIAHSGAALGPAEFNKGDVSRHVLFFNYAYAPGDSNGYLADQPGANDKTPVPGGQTVANVAQALSMDQRTGTVKAIQFNRDFRPAMLLFNGQPQTDDMIVDGAFNPGRMVNATLFAAGYRYESMEYGSFETKLITASLNEVPGQEVSAYYAAVDSSPTLQNEYDLNGDRPAGFFGRSLGVELDLKYDYKVGREADVGVGGAVALPGKAWQTEVGSKPATDMMVQTFAAFFF